MDTAQEKRAKYLMADIPDEQRPREKALANGVASLSDAELMAMIFGTGIKGKGVMALCNEILEHYDNHISRISRLSAADFIKEHKGIGPAKALTLLAGIELGIRAAADAIIDKHEPISTSQKAFDYMHRHLYNLPHEEFWILLLKQNLEPMAEVKIGQGGLSATAVDVKVIMRHALTANASAIMLFHNHPSGALTPSAQDTALTHKICDAAKLLDIRVLDHLIIGRDSFYSFRDQGRI